LHPLHIILANKQQQRVCLHCSMAFNYYWHKMLDECNCVIKQYNGAATAACVCAHIVPGALFIHETAAGEQSRPSASRCCRPECCRCHFSVVPESEFRPQFQSRAICECVMSAQTRLRCVSHYIFYLANWAASSGGGINMIHYFALGSHTMPGSKHACSKRRVC
jgi:hypothetical protein